MLLGYGLASVNNKKKQTSLIIFIHLSHIASTTAEKEAAPSLATSLQMNRTASLCVCILYLYAKTFRKSEGSSPQSVILFPALLMNFFHSLHWLAYPTALPIKWSNASIPCLCFQLTICIHRLHKTYNIRRSFENSAFSILSSICVWSDMNSNFRLVSWLMMYVLTRGIPSSVGQHMLWSSICSTSRPMNHAPSETSSFAYLCNICLQSHNFTTLNSLANRKVKQHKIV